MHLWGQKYHRGSHSPLCSCLCFTWIHTSVPFQFHANSPRCSHAHQEVPRGDFFELDGGPMAWVGTILLRSHWWLGWQGEGFGNRTMSSLWLQVTETQLSPYNGEDTGTALGSEGRSLGTRASGTATERLMPISHLHCTLFLSPAGLILSDSGQAFPM